MLFNRAMSFTSLALAAFLLAAPIACAESTTDAKTAPSGVYQMDPDHASITFKIPHLGFSRYTGRFDKMEGTLNFNSAAPEQSSLDVTVYTNSIDTNNAKLEEELRGDKFFDVMKYQRATFHTTKIVVTSPTTGRITGDFTLKGVTHSITLDATLIGTGTHPFSKKTVLGFSAVGTIRRSDYGLSNLIPMVGDDVTLELEAEFDQAQ